MKHDILINMLLLMRKKSKYEMFKLNLIAYHWQFKLYFDKKGYLPDIDKVLESHNYQYKDFYKELYIQKNCIFI